MSQPKHNIATRVVHGGHAPSAGEPVVTPLVQSVNYVEEIGTAEGLRYPRYGNVPNAEHVQRRLAALEGAEAALRMLSDGEMAWVEGPRRQELATIIVDDAVPKGGVVLRDIAGLVVSEIVTLRKPDMDTPPRRDLV